MPNDIPFTPRGILAEGEINDDMVVTADLDLELLYQVREKVRLPQSGIGVPNSIRIGNKERILLLYNISAIKQNAYCRSM